MAAVGRPEVIAADLQFFGVEPIDFAVQDVLVRIFGQLLLFLTGSGLHVEVVFTQVGDMAAIGRELRVVSRLRCGGELHRGAALQTVEPQLTQGIEQKMLGIGGPPVGSDGITSNAFLLALILDLVHVRGQGRELSLADQNFLFARSRIDVPQFPMLSGIVALDEGQHGAVGTPLKVFGSAAGQTTGRYQGFDGEWLLLIVNCCLGGQG